jgi:hypothetical protein
LIFDITVLLNCHQFLPSWNSWLLHLHINRTGLIQLLTRSNQKILNRFIFNKFNQLPNLCL